MVTELATGLASTSFWTKPITTPPVSVRTPAISGPPSDQQTWLFIESPRRSHEITSPLLITNIRQVGPSALPPERRIRYLFDIAMAAVKRDRTDEAIATVLEAEHLSPSKSTTTSWPNGSSPTSADPSRAAGILAWPNSTAALVEPEQQRDSLQVGGYS